MAIEVRRHFRLICDVGGELYNSTRGKRHSGEGIFAEQIAQMFEVARRKAGITGDFAALSTAAFRRPGGAQLSLFSIAP